MPRAVEVEISGLRFLLRTDADEEYVRAVAAHVQETIEGLKARNPTSPESHRLAILAALNISEELFREKAARKKLREKSRKMAQTMLESINQLQEKR
jgi:cell division protein ZapA (FtsZ GTPase activity inhibitor)